MKITLGYPVKDIITGFTGIAIARADYMFSVSQIQVQPRDVQNGGAPVAPVWFEESRLAILPNDEAFTGFQS